MIRVDTFPKTAAWCEETWCRDSSTLEPGLCAQITTAGEKKLRSIFDFYHIFEFKDSHFTKSLHFSRIVKFSIVLLFPM